MSGNSHMILPLLVRLHTPLDKYRQTIEDPCKIRGYYKIHLVFNAINSLMGFMHRHMIHKLLNGVALLCAMIVTIIVWLIQMCDISE